MKSVTISPKYQVVIPREVRQSMEIKPGTKVQVLLYENRIELIPMKNLRRMRGFLKGIDTTVEREGTGYERRRFVWNEWDKNTIKTWIDACLRV